MSILKIKEFINNYKVVVSCASIAIIGASAVTGFVLYKNNKLYNEMLPIAIELGLTEFYQDNTFVKNSSLDYMKNAIDTTTSNLDTDLALLDELIKEYSLEMDTNLYSTLLEEVDYKDTIVNDYLDDEINKNLNIKYTNNVPTGQNLTAQKELKANEQELRKVDYTTFTIDEKVDFLAQTTELNTDVALNNKSIDSTKKTMDSKKSNSSAETNNQVAQASIPSNDYAVTPVNYDSIDYSSQSNNNTSNNQTSAYTPPPVAPMCPYATQGEAISAGEASGYGYMVITCSDLTYNYILSGGADSPSGGSNDF